MNRRARRAVAARKSGCATFTTRIVPPRIRRGLLLGASGLTVAIALAHEAAAVNECGIAAGAPPSVTCKATGNPYPNGITYDVTDLTIVVKSSVVVDTTTTTGELGGIVSGGSVEAPGGSGNLSITLNPGASITTDETMAPGVIAVTGTGTATINSKANITTSGAFFGAGLWAESETDDVSITAAGNITTSGELGFGINAVTFGDDITSKVSSSATITTAGNFAFGIFGDTGAGTNADVTITSSGKITTSGDFAAGLYGFTGTGHSTIGVDSDIQIVNTGIIVTKGGNSKGIRAITHGHDSAITAVSTGSITTSGIGADGINAAAHLDNSDVKIASTGSITTSGTDASGIEVFTGGVDSDVTVVSTGPIVTGEYFGHGIQVTTWGAGSDIVITSTGSITTSGDYAYGINALTAFGPTTISVTSTGAITTAGLLSFGIHANAAFGATTVISTGAIVTEGDQADGIRALSATDKVQAISTAAISTSGADADGIHAFTPLGDVVVGSSGTIQTSGADSEGIWVEAGKGAITIVAPGTITTSGATSDAVHAESPQGPVTVDVKSASASGQDSDGIDVTNGDSGAVSIGISGAVSGGWGSAVGVKVKAVDGASITITKAGAVGALTDFAFSEGGEDLQVTNRGSIVGFFETDGGNDTITNASSGVWEFRDFSDTDGNGTRDAERVAFANFGPGNDTFNNSGTVRLSNVIGATTVNSIGQIVDPFGTDGDVALAGVEHGQMVGLEQFVNAGTITLQDGTVGDALAITDQPVAGAGGGGVFTSNGGSLKLDVFLDDGSSGKTDMLFLDIAKSGAGGATQVFVTNAGGAGALTKGDGIQIINVDVSSTSDAFTLGAPVVAGAFEYDLEFQNLAGTDQSWYLRSAPFAGALAYPSISSSALTTWRADLAAFENRLSDLRLNMSAPAVTVPMLPGFADAGSVTLDPARFTGGWFNMTDSDDVVAQSGIAGFSQETTRAEMGFDFALDNVSGRDDWLVIGAFGGQGRSQADFADADSSADFDVASMGVYASYFQGPYHMDALVKFDWLDGDYSSDAVSGGGDVQLPVFGVSLSTGYQFDLTQSAGGGLSLQPVASLDYAHVGGDTFRDDSGATVELMEMDSLRGRLGARLVQQLLPNEDGTGPVGNVHLSAGVAQEFLGQSEARVTGVTLTQELPQTTFELGAGFDLALPQEGVSFTFDTNADLSAGEDNYAATGGVRFTW